MAYGISKGGNNNYYNIKNVFTFLDFAGNFEISTSERIRMRITTEINNYVHLKWTNFYRYLDSTYLPS